MRYGIALPNYGALAGPDNLRRLARRAEECGLDSDLGPEAIAGNAGEVMRD
jgi:hypothetical protein